MTDLDHAPDPENATPDSDFIGSASHVFQGELLEPFSIRRQFAAQALGHKLLSGRANLADGGAYDGFYLDVAMVIYLCRCPKSELHLACRKPEDVREKVLAWAEAVKMAPGSPVFTEASEIYTAIFEEVTRAQFKVEEPEGGGGGPKKAEAGHPTAG